MNKIIHKTVVAERANICRGRAAAFEGMSIRHLDVRNDLIGRYDVAVCCKNIEPIIFCLQAYKPKLTDDQTNQPNTAHEINNA